MTNYEENKKIKKENIKRLGYTVGQSVKGKGHKIYNSYGKKFIGYFPISRYTIDEIGQKTMIADFLKKFEGKSVYIFYDSDYFNDNDIKYINEYRDWFLIHGSSYYATNTYDSYYIDGRVYNYNQLIIDEFWYSFEYKEKEYLKDIDPDDKISVFTYKDKDWYIGYSIFYQEIGIVFKEEGHKYDYIFYMTYIKEDKELLKRIKEIVQSWKEDIEFRGFIYNMFDINNNNYDNYYLNSKSYIANILYEDVVLFQADIEERINTNNIRNIFEDDFNRIFDNIIKERIKILNDNTIEVKRMTVNGVKIEKYNHLKVLEKLGKKLDYELVYTNILDSMKDDEAFAIKKYNEEYHFNIFEVIYKDITNEQPLKEFIKFVLNQLELRKIEKIKEQKLLEKAKNVFVSIEDSLEAGNCKLGTEVFLKRHKINAKRIGGIRGDELLKMENSKYTKRAVYHAIKRIEKEYKNKQYTY